MDIKKILTYIRGAFERVNDYAACICDTADDEIRDIIMAICNQEIKAIQYNLDLINFKGEKNERL